MLQRLSHTHCHAHVTQNTPYPLPLLTYYKQYRQAQFKFSTISVQFELRLSLKLGYYHPPTPNWESRDAATSGLPRALKFGMEALFNQTRSTS